MNSVARFNPIQIIDRIVPTILRITYRDIYGFGMMLIGIVAIWKPAGSILLADEIFGVPPVVHGFTYIIAGWMMSRHRSANGLFRFIYTLPLLSYIFLTLVFINLNWERANPVVLVQYIMLYASVLKLIAVKVD